MLQLVRTVFGFAQLCVTLGAFLCAGVSAEDQESPQKAQPRQVDDWANVLDRLRVLSRPGVLQNSRFSAELAAIFSDSMEVRVKTQAIQRAYEQALVERAAKWEAEAGALRAMFDEKVIQELPDEKRESARKFLDAGRAKIAAAADRDAKTRAEFLERMRAAVQASISQSQNPGTPKATPETAEASKWMKSESEKAGLQDMQSIQDLRSTLAPDDEARFDRISDPRRFMATQPNAGSVAPNASVKPVPPPTDDSQSAPKR